MTNKEKASELAIKLEGAVVVESIIVKNCHSKIRKVVTNKFERIYLCGKHAFNYSVITENLSNNNIKETMFPTRKEALCFFMMSVKKYD